MLRSSLAVLASILCFGVPSAAPAGDEAPPLPEVAAWEAFCDAVKDGGVAILRSHPREHEIDRAEALRYLADELAAAIQRSLDDAALEAPVLRIGATSQRKWGLDGADAKYQNARIDGNGRYRLTGTLGGARIVAVQTASEREEFAAFDSIAGEDLGADAAGAFSLLIAPERPDGYAGAFLQTRPRANVLLVREYFADWAAETPSTLLLERLDGAAAPAPLELDGARQILAASAGTFRQRAPYWVSRLTEPTRANLANRLIARGGESAQGLAGNVYGSGAFDLAPDEALLITLDEPVARLWSFQLGNIWSESIDYVNHTASWNSEQVFVNADGRVRLVIAATDPGVPNWLDPAGHPAGQILYRFQHAKTRPVPETEVVPLASLRARLPADTPVVTSAERARQIRARRADVGRRWAP